MYECWYDYIKLNYGGKTKLCYTDTDSFVVHLKLDLVGDVGDLVGDVEKRLNTSNYWAHNYN